MQQYFEITERFSVAIGQSFGLGFFKDRTLFIVSLGPIELCWWIGA